MSSDHAAATAPDETCAPLSDRARVQAEADRWRLAWYRDCTSDSAASKLRLEAYERTRELARLQTERDTLVAALATSADDVPRVRALVRQNGEMATKLRKLRDELTTLYRANEAKNRTLDAMHYVWCSGGCAGAVDRDTTHPPLTPELLAEAVRNVERMGGVLQNRAWRRDPPPVAEEVAALRAELRHRTEAQRAAEDRAAVLAIEVAELRARLAPGEAPR